MEAIIQIIVGLGMVGMLWRLTTTVAELSTHVKHIVSRVDDHEVRIRNQEGK